MYRKSKIMKMNSDNPKYQDIFKTGKELFWKFGVKRVTIEEICKEARVSKMTFYKFFPNKISLARTIFETEMNHSLVKFDNIAKSDLPFTEKIKEFFRLKFESTKNISVEFISDIYKNPELGLREDIEQKTQEVFRIFVDFLVDSQQKGLIRKNIKIDFILNYINQMIQMFDNLEFVKKYENTQDLIMEAMDFLFYGILNKNEDN